MSFPLRGKIIFLLLACIYASPIHSQELQQKRFADWIKEIEESHEIGFSYNYSLFDNLMVEIPTDCSELDNCLQQISDNNPLQFEKAEDNQFLILPVRKPATFKAVDSETNETINALRVTVNDREELYLLPSQNSYTVPNLFPTDFVLIQSRFYSSQQFQASDLFGLDVPLTLSPDTIYLQEVIIEDYLSSGVDTRLSDHSMQVDMQSLGLLAGETDGDILNVLKSLPGIRTPDGKPGSLNFRGSTFDHTLIYFDDIPIYHSGHFFGTISPYNPAAVRSVNVYRGVLPAKWGGRVGGLIDLQTENSIVDSTRFTVSANSIYAGINMTTPIQKNKVGVSLSARSNYPIDYLAPKLDALRTLNFQGSRIDPTIENEQRVVDQFDVRFQDFNGKVILELNENNRATLSFMNIQNRFVYNLDSRDLNQMERQVSDLDNWGITGKWSMQLNDRLKLDLGATTSSLELFESNTITEPNTQTQYEDISNTIKDLRVNLFSEYQISDQWKLETGYQLTDHEVTLDERMGMAMPRMNQKNEAKIHSVHVSTQTNWTNRFVTNIGIHYDYYSRLSNQYFDPRLTMSYMVSDYFYLKASGGRSHQFIKRLFNNDFDDFRLQNQFWSLADEGRPVLEGTQGMIGFLIDKSGWLVDVEFYKKNTKGLARQDVPLMDAIGSLSTTGTDFFIKRRWTQFEVWGSYSLSKVNTDFARLVTAFNNQKHILSLTAILRKDRWNFATTWSYLSGMPVLFPMTLPNGPSPGNQPPPGSPPPFNIPYSGEFPSQHQLDLSITYKFLQRGNDWSSVIGLSILNVYDRQNVINIFQNNTRPEQPIRYAVGFAPNLSVTINF